MAGSRTEARGPVRTVALSVDIGAGHRRAAEAVGAALEERRPGSRLHVVDVLEHIGADGGEVAKALYFGLIKDAPALWGAAYASGGASELFRSAGEVADDVRSVSLAPEVRGLEPDLILAMHPFACGLGASLARMGEVSCPVAAVLTDLDAHPAWIGRGLDLYLAGTDDVAAALRARGLPTGEVAVTGIPLRPQFGSVREIGSPHGALGFAPELLTIVLLGGGLGLGPIGETARELMSLEGPIQLVLMAGANEELLRQGQRWAETSPLPLHVRGHVENVWDYMAAADLAVSKPGGLTASELLAAGVPLVALDPIPGQEQANASTLVAVGAAVEVAGPAQARRAVEALLRSPGDLEAMRLAALRVGRPASAGHAARALLDLVDGWSPRRRPSPRPLDTLSATSRGAAAEVDAFARAVGDTAERGFDSIAEATDGALKGLDGLAKRAGLTGKGGLLSSLGKLGEEPPRATTSVEEEIARLRRKLRL